MNLKRASVLGYCMGVRRAVEMAERVAKEGVSGKLWTLGPLIHNNYVLAALKKAGFDILTDELCENLAGAVVIVRAHGVGPQIKQALIARGAKIVDATCPKVRKSQQKAAEFAQNGYHIFIAGEKQHAEVQGIIGYAPNSIAVSTSSEAKAAAAALLQHIARPVDPPRTALLAQTTLSKEEFDAIAVSIKQVFPDLEVCDTICNATKDRQQALLELCGGSDAIIIAGDSRSANSRRLLSIAQSQGKPAWLVEDAAALPACLPKNGTIGLSAGASTPDEIIEDIEKAIIRGAHK